MPLRAALTLWLLTGLALADAATPGPGERAPTAAPVMPAPSTGAIRGGWPPAEVTAESIIEAAIDQTRGHTSHAEIELRIRRPDWERNARFVAWTRGRDDALIRFTAPPRDAGNGTLKVGTDMWTYNPRLRRVIRLPESLMSQSWAGTDFSYNDLSRSDVLLREYDLRLVSSGPDPDAGSGRVIHVIDAIPHADAPIVWGRERLEVRADNVLLSHTFFDQDGLPLKRLETLEVREQGGRTIPARMRMSRLDEPGRYTELEYVAIDFDVELDDSTFTQFRLRGD